MTRRRNPAQPASAATPQAINPTAGKLRMYCLRCGFGGWLPAGPQACPSCADPLRLSPEGEAPNEPLALSSALELLSRHAMPSLSDAELQYLSGIDGCAEEIARRTAKLVEGLGCLIADDEQVGSFQSPASMASLLFNIAGQFNAVAGLLCVACMVQTERSDREGGAS